MKMCSLPPDTRKYLLNDLRSEKEKNLCPVRLKFQTRAADHTGLTQQNERPGHRFTRKDGEK